MRAISNIQLKLAPLLAATAVMSVSSLNGLTRFAGGEVTLSAGATLGYDSNIFTRSIAVDDYLSVLRVGLDYNSERTYYTVGAGLDFSQGLFLENTSVNYSDVSYNFNFSPTDIFGGRRFSVDTNFSYQLESDSSPEVGARTKEDIYSASMGVRYSLRRDLSTRMSLSYNRQDPRSVDGFFDPITNTFIQPNLRTRESVRLGVNVDYQRNKFLNFTYQPEVDATSQTATITCLTVIGMNST